MEQFLVITGHALNSYTSTINIVETFAQIAFLGMIWVMRNHACMADKCFGILSCCRLRNYHLNVFEVHRWWFRLVKVFHVFWIYSTL